MNRYRVMVAPGFLELEAMVSHALGEGWELYGELHLDPIGNARVCFREMVLPDTAVPPVVETPRCKKCQGSGYTVVGEVFCTCSLGRELLKLERRDLPNMGDPSD